MWVNGPENGTVGSGHAERSNGIDDDGDGLIDDWRGWDYQQSNNDPMTNMGTAPRLQALRPQLAITAPVLPASAGLRS